MNPTPEFHRLVGIPRTAAIEYPYGRPLGETRDVEGQRAVLLDTLRVLAEARTPGEIRHLPYVWPEDPKETKWHPPEMSPIVAALLEEIRAARKKSG